MQVHSLMTRDVITVREDTPLNDVASRMSESGISGVPVLNEEGDLTGIITELDMIARNARLEIPVFIQILDVTFPLELPGHLRDKLRHMFGTQARDVMTEKVRTVEHDAELEDLVELMMKKRVNPVPVTENGRLVGIVSRSDLIRMMAAKLG